MNLKITGAVPESIIYIKMPIRKVASKVKSVAKKVVNKAMAPMRRQRAAAKMKEMDLMERHRKMQSGQMPYRY